MICHFTFFPLLSKSVSVNFFHFHAPFTIAIINLILTHSNKIFEQWSDTKNSLNSLNLLINSETTEFVLKFLRTNQNLFDPIVTRLMKRLRCLTQTVSRHVNGKLLTLGKFIDPIKYIRNLCVPKETNINCCVASWAFPSLKNGLHAFISKHHRCYRNINFYVLLLNVSSIFDKLLCLL